MSKKSSSIRNVNLKQVKEVKWPSTDTGGVMPMSIESRFADERHRLSEDYNEKWRAYRIKYIKSLSLHGKDPRDVPGLYKEFYNPIRRFYRAPLNLYEKLATPYLGKHYSQSSRKGISMFIGFYSVSLFVYYVLNYSENTNRWDSDNTINMWSARPEVLPGDPLYPLQNPKPYDWQFADRGFSKRKSHLNI